MRPLTACIVSTAAILLAPAICLCAGPPDGGALYRENCAPCHGPVETSSVKGARADAIASAISENEGGMGSFSGLTMADIKAISQALSAVSGGAQKATASGGEDTGKGRPNDRGTGLYAKNCVLCHGPIEKTTIIKGSTEGMMKSAISKNFGGMGRFSNMPSGDLRAIAGAISTDSAPDEAPAPSAPPRTATADGASLYAARCAVCHGPLTGSSKSGATSGRIQSAITGNVGGMGSLSSLIPSEVQAIAGALSASSVSPVLTSSPAPGAAPAASPSSQPVPTNAGGGDGVALYASDCAGCHGPLASSAKSGATAERIKAAISGNTGGMGSLSGLGQADIQAIATALGGPPTAGGTASSGGGAFGGSGGSNGASLYVSNCAGCHGPLATSAKRGAAAQRIMVAIGANMGGMGSLATLSPSDILSISNALGKGLLPSTGAGGKPSGAADGASLYGSNCQACHGPLASSAKKGATPQRIQAAIGGNTGGMGSLSSLSQTDIQAIATALGGATAPVGTVVGGTTTGGGAGAALYQTNCLPCHGPLAGSSKQGATAQRIQAAISGNTGGMSSLAGISPADIQAIADALGGAGAGGGAGGKNTGCTSCHVGPIKSGVRSKGARPKTPGGAIKMKDTGDHD